MPASASSQSIIGSIINMQNRLMALEDEVQFLRQRLFATSQAQLGPSSPYIINLDTQIFECQSPTGASGERFRGIADLVPFEPSNARPNGGVGPTGAQSGFWSRRAGV